MNLLIYFLTIIPNFFCASSGFKNFELSTTANLLPNKPLNLPRLACTSFQDFVNIFSDCDLILTPTAPSSAFPLNEKQNDPIKMYLNDVFTVPASLAGIPGISIPYGHDKQGLPLGIQLLGKHYNEQEIFNAAYALEKDYA